MLKQGTVRRRLGAACMLCLGLGTLGLVSPADISAQDRDRPNEERPKGDKGPRGEKGEKGERAKGEGPRERRSEEPGSVQRDEERVRMLEQELKAARERLVKDKTAQPKPNIEEIERVHKEVAALHEQMRATGEKMQAAMKKLAELEGRPMPAGPGMVFGGAAMRMPEGGGPGGFGPGGPMMGGRSGRAGTGGGFGGEGGERRPNPGAAQGNSPVPTSPQRPQMLQELEQMKKEIAELKAAVMEMRKK